jgi:hypothetical protein
MILPAEGTNVLDNEDSNEEDGEPTANQSMNRTTNLIKEGKKEVEPI